MTNLEKNHETALRILEILKILLADNASKDEIIDKLKIHSDIGDVGSYEAFIKYFNTLNLSGLTIERNKKKYCLKNSVIQASLSEREKNIIIKLTDYIGKLGNKTVRDISKRFFFKLDKFIDIDLTEFTDKNIELNDRNLTLNIKNNKLITLKKMLEEDFKVCLTYRKKNGETESVTTELKKITETKNNAYIVCYDSVLGRNQKINVDSIISINQNPQKKSGMNYLNSVIFELYGRLASSYKLKPSEKALKFGHNFITVSNSEEDKESLLLRLLKYGENCKIIRPSYIQEEFLDMTNVILKNLES